jgi:hypothetical protein
MLLQIDYSYAGDTGGEMPIIDDLDMSDIEGLEGDIALSAGADSIEMNQSASLVTAGDEIVMNESASFITLADRVDANKSSMFLVIADEINGEYSTVFTPKTALIFGFAFGVGMFVLSSLFRPFRRR